MEEDEVPETQQEEEKPTGNRRPSARGGRFATEVDAEQEPTVLSQALPSLRGEFYTYLVPLLLNLLMLCCPPSNARCLCMPHA